MGIGIPVPFSWAGSAINYPPSSSPWSSTAVEAAPAYAFLTPGLANAPTAQEVNYVWDKLAKSARDGIGAAGSVLAQNWQASYTPASLVSAAGFAWNPVLGLWVTCSGNSGVGANTFYTVTGYDQASPVALSSTFGLASGGAAMANGAIACDAAGASYVGAIVSGVVYLGTCVAGTAVGAGGAVGAGVTSIAISAAANFAIVGYASSTGHAGVVWMNPNSGATTIASFESNLSATTFVTGSNGTYCLAVGQNGHAYKMVSSGTVGTTSVTDTNISATIGTDIPTGLAWGTSPGAINGAWLLQCLPSGGGSIRRYYSSTDGISWGAGGASTSSVGAAGTGLVAVGSLWASPVPTPPTTSILPQIMYTPDASIWHAVPQSGTGATSSTAFFLSANDHQMCFMNFQSGAQVVRFSSFAGFGAALT